MEKTSLVFSYNEGWQDFFRQRIIFPIFDVRGRVIGFGARRYREKEDIPKYINSLENPLYSKRENLFGLNFAKDEIVKKDFVVVAEGYLDMIVPFMKGIKNIVASLGTALTLEQIRLIKRYTSNVIVVFDSDKAGQLASLRALDILLENDLKVKIVNLPSGYDPDSLVRESGKEAFLHFINKKVDFLDYKIEVLKNMYDIESIEGKTKISQEMLSTLDKLKSEVERYEYIKKLSQILKIKEEILLAEYRRLFSKSEKVGLKESVFDKEPLSLTEKIILKFMLTNEKAFSLVKENLKEEDFSSSLARTTVSYLFKNFSRSDFRSSNFLAKIEDKKVSGFISAILMDDSVPLDKESFRTSIIKLKKKRVRFLREKLKEEIKKAELRGDRERCKELINKFYKINSEVKNG
jgi:DNA primase